MPTLRELTNLLKEPRVAELSLVARAYAFAEKAHERHTRYSGEPYFTHLFETAKILAEIGAGATAVAAGLLHDSIEDVGASAEALKKEFGDEVFRLIEGVTKLGHLRYRGEKRYSESLRRFFVASAKDLRVIIIKLADRLHNMRTLAHVPKEKQYRIARETLEIYAPLAYRLGIRKINRELQDLAFPFVHPEEFARVKTLLTEKESRLSKRLEKFHRSLLKGLASHGIAPRSSHGRIKGIYSLFIKLERKGWDWEEIYDLLAVRLVVGSIEDCYRTLGVVHALCRPLPGRIKDYIAFPKPNGYRSLHTNVFSGDGHTVEIQIRTEEMHRESEYGIAVHFEYKDLSEEPHVDTSYLAWAKKMLQALVSWRASSPGEELPMNSPSRVDPDMPPWIQTLGDLGGSLEEQEFWQNLKDDIFRNRVFVLTPKGDVVDLPAFSSPIDFAYAIHSDIGDHVFAAKVNGKMVSLDTPLKNGDIVEIVRREASYPSPKWLLIAKTALAKKHIRNALLRLGIRQ